MSEEADLLARVMLVLWDYHEACGIRNYGSIKMTIDNLELVCYTAIKRGDTRWIFS